MWRPHRVTINAKEGMRRLALLLGAVGAILGGFASYMELSSVLNQRARHNKFEHLANSPVATQAKRDCLTKNAPESADHFVSDSPTLLPSTVDAFVAAPEEKQREALANMSVPAKTALLDALRQRNETVVDKDGITIIHWTKDYGVESIETEDGQTLYPTPAPSAWIYLLITAIPVLGFFISWGAVRAVRWVGVGFTTP
jgi:hypothetical protein